MFSALLALTSTVRFYCEAIVVSILCNLTLDNHTRFVKRSIIRLNMIHYY